MGDVTPRLASMISREIQALEGRTGREPVLLDVRAATAEIAGSVAMALAVSYAVATAGGAPTAVVGRRGAGAAAAQQLMGERVAWFAAPAQARRWLREQMVA